MKYLPTSLNALRAFEAAARHLSFTKAAEELHVTPAAVSHLVKRLESDLGVTLFHRLKNGLALTEASQAGLPLLQRGFCAIGKSIERLRGDLRNSVIAVEAPPSFASRWLLPRTSRFVASHPDLDLRIAASDEMIDDNEALSDGDQALRDGSVDVAIHFGLGRYPGCRVDHLFNVSAVPLCSPELLQGDRPLRGPDDLAKHVLLHDETPYRDHPDWKTWLEEIGAHSVNPHRGPRFNSVSLALQAAVDGQGVLLSIDALARDELAAGRLVIPFDRAMPLQYAYYLISLDETAELPRISAFRVWLLQEAAEFRHRWPPQWQKPVAQAAI